MLCKYWDSILAYTTLIMLVLNYSPHCWPSDHAGMEKLAAIGTNRGCFPQHIFKGKTILRVIMVMKFGEV